MIMYSLFRIRVQQSTSWVYTRILTIKAFSAHLNIFGASTLPDHFANVEKWDMQTDVLNFWIQYKKDYQKPISNIY